MPGTLLVSDLDGTLLDGRGRLTARSGALLTGAIDRGASFTIATARSSATALRALAGLPLHLPAVTYGGAFVVAPDGRVTWRACLAAGIGQALVEEAEAEGLAPLVFWLRDGADRLSWRRGAEQQPRVRRFLASRRGDPRLLPVHDWTAVVGQGVFFVSLLAPIGRLAAFAAAMRGSAWGGGLTVALQPAGRGGEGSVLDVTAARVDKASGVRRVAAEGGFDRVVAFGDGANDLPLFRAADEAWAVAGAAPALRAEATGVLKPGVDAVAEWVDAHA